MKILLISTAITLFTVATRYTSYNNELKPIGSLADSIKVDPVCKMKVRQNEKAINYLYQQKKYYFCNERCKNSFKQNPKHYIKTVE